MNDMTPEQMRVLEEDAHNALQEAIDNGGRLRMTIPAEVHKDTDLRIARALAALRTAADQLEAVQQWCKDNGAPATYPVAPFTFEKGVSAAANDVLAILTTETAPSA